MKPTVPGLEALIPIASREVFTAVPAAMGSVIVRANFYGFVFQHIAFLETF